MANCTISTTATFATSQAYHRAERPVILATKGKTGITFVKSNALHPSWSDDATKVYCGLIPVIDGTQRLDLALLMGDIVLDVVYGVDAEGKRTETTPSDRLHSTARRLADTAGATYDTILDGVVAEFTARPGTSNPMDITAISAKGRNYPKAIQCYD